MQAITLLRQHQRIGRPGNHQVSAAARCRTAAESGSPPGPGIHILCLPPCRAEGLCLVGRLMCWAASGPLGFTARQQLLTPRFFRSLTTRRTFAPDFTGIRKLQLWSDAASVQVAMLSTTVPGRLACCHLAVASGLRLAPARQRTPGNKADIHNRTVRNAGLKVLGFRRQGSADSAEY